MSIIIENIKLYNPFNNRYLFFNYTILIIMLFMLAAGIGKNELVKAFSNNQWPFIHMFFLIISMYSLGTITTMVQVEILTKPISSCLPDQNKIAVTTLFLIGIFANLVYFIVFLLLPRPAGLKGVLYLLSIPAFGLLLFFLGSLLSFYMHIERQKGSVAFVVFMLCLIALGPLSAIHGFTFDFEYFLFYGSIPMLFFVMLFLFALWKRLLQPDMKRIFFARDLTLNLDFSPTKATQLQEVFMLKGLSEKVEKENRIDDIFFVRIKKLPYLNIKRSVVAGLYCILDRYCTLNGRFLRSSSLIKFLIPTILLILSGYIDSDEITGIEAFYRHFITCLIFSTPCFLVVGTLNPVLHNHLFPEGRFNHFCKSMIIWLAKPLIVIIWTSLVILVAWCLKELMPGFTLAGIYFQYNVPVLSLIVWQLVLILVMDIFGYYFENPCSLITMVLFVAILLVLYLFSFFTDNQIHRFISMVLAILLANGFFMERLARHWFRKDIGFLN